MAKKTKTIIRSAVDIADELEVVRTAIADRKSVERSLTSQLLTALHAEQRTHAGNYKISQKTTLKVVEPQVALEWAAQTNCLKIDVTKAKEIMRHTFDTPEKFGFEKVTTEAIIPIRTKEVEED